VNGDLVPNKKWEIRQKAGKNANNNIKQIVLPINVRQLQTASVAI